MTPKTYFSKKRRRFNNAAHTALSVFLVWLVAVVIAPITAGLAYQLFQH